MNSSPIFAQQVEQVSFRNGVDSPTNSLGFRIDSDIYLDLNKSPIKQVKTLFTDKQTVEIDENDRRIKLLDFSLGSMTILNTNDRTMVELDFQAIDNQLKEVLALAPSPTAGIPVHQESDSIRLGDANVFYQVKTVVPPVPQMAVRYNEFTDWATKVAAIFPPYKPPQLRLQLNQQLMDQRLLPMETKLTRQDNGKSQDIYARLLLSDTLSSNDQQELIRVKRLTTEFKLKTATEFFRTK